MKYAWERLQQYPARFTAAIQATLAVFVLIGVLPDYLVGAIMIAISAWVAFWVHGAVTPMATLPDKVEAAKAPEDTRTGAEIVFEIFNKVGK